MMKFILFRMEIFAYLGGPSKLYSGASSSLWWGNFGWLVWLFWDGMEEGFRTYTFSGWDLCQKRWGVGNLWILGLCFFFHLEIGGKSTKKIGFQPGGKGFFKVCRNGAVRFQQELEAQTSEQRDLWICSFLGKMKHRGKGMKNLGIPGGGEKNR